MHAEGMKFESHVFQKEKLERYGCATLFALATRVMIFLTESKRGASSSSSSGREQQQQRWKGAAPLTADEWGTVCLCALLLHHCSWQCSLWIRCARSLSVACCRCCCCCCCCCCCWPAEHRAGEACRRWKLTIRLSVVYATAMTTARDFCKSLWRNMDEAENALHIFSAAQGWSANSCTSKTYRYEWRDEENQPQLGTAVEFKTWICSRGRQKGDKAVHACSINSADPNQAGPSHCDELNSTAKLAPIAAGETRLLASAKTGCSVTVRIAMVRKPLPANSTWWTSDDRPCVGYRVTTNPKLLEPCVHNHPAAAVQQELTESVAQVATDVRKEIQALVLAKFSSYRIRNFISQKHSLPPMLPAVWSSLVRSLKIELGIQDAGDDLAVLIERLTSERNERGAVFDMQVDSFGDLTVSTIFFMSREMLASFRRCGQFTVMDSTCKTNRFGLNLFLVCGVDEHRHIALFAAAFMKEETQPRFEYVLRQMQRAAGEEAWMRMACVATDGCAAMTNALFEVAPHTMQQRCVWHLQQNIIKHAGGAAHQHVVAAWWACVYAKTQQEFDARWSEMLQKKMSPKLSEYLVARILPLAPKWAVHATGCLTNFGSHSTQLVESLNRLLKMWDASDRTSLSQAVERICTVKEEEQRKMQITSMRVHSSLVMAHGAAAAVQAHDTYVVKVQKVLTTAAAQLCEAEYHLYSQYKVIAQASSGLFSLATQTCCVQHKADTSRQHVVHVSPSLIYCPCGFMFAYLLPCRHILAANGDAFADIFQLQQYHPRWLQTFTPQLQHTWLTKQFWISVGKNVTAPGLSRLVLSRARQAEQRRGAEAEEEQLDLSGGNNMDEELHEFAGDAGAAAAAASAVPALPDPMFVPQSSLQPVEMSPQHLYHMIEGQCQQLRQLACSNPARLSSMVWVGLNSLKQQVEQHIEGERRQQQRMATSGASAVLGNLTSEGVPLSSLLAPVPISASKPGRPSHKRAHAAVEGKVAARLRLMMPAAALECGGDGGAASEGTAEGVEGADRKAKHRRREEVSPSACAAAPAVASAAAVAVAAAAAASASSAAPVSPSLSLPGSAAAAVAAACACSAVELGRGKRVVVLPVHLRD